MNLGLLALRTEKKMNFLCFKFHNLLKYFYYFFLFLFLVANDYQHI